MTHYATRGAVIDRFLADHDVDPGDVLACDFAVPAQPGIDVALHIYDRVDGLDYARIGNSPHLYANVEREDLTIRITYVIPEVVAR